MLSIKTNRFVNAVVEAPPSKSYTNRALIIAALAKGKSVLKNALFSDDTIYMIKALKKFGVKIKRKNKDIIVDGINGNPKNPVGKIFVGNAGTTMRFITAFAALSLGNVEITGDKRMNRRPIKDLLDALNNMGVQSNNNDEFPPVTISGGNFDGGKIKLKGDVSSQFLSSILMCSPYAKNDVEITIVGDLASKPYVDITIDIMRTFGADVKNHAYKRFTVRKNKKYKPRNYLIEGDASNASYFMAAAAISRGKVKIKNLNPNSKQGDIKFADILKNMGCVVRKGRDFIEVQGKDMKGIDVDMNDLPDVVQTLAVVSLFAQSETTIRNVANLRVKETDRLKALSFELKKIGANVVEVQDGLKIKRKRLQKAVINTYNDHRMAMSFAVAGLCISGIRIKNPSCVNKSFPQFWEKFDQLYRK